jgi:hypothetical protein
MMRNTDRTLANIENMPGGFDYLRQHYENVVEPIQQATQAPIPQFNQNTVCIFTIITFCNSLFFE